MMLCSQCSGNSILIHTNNTWLAVRDVASHDFAGLGCVLLGRIRPGSYDAAQDTNPEQMSIMRCPALEKPSGALLEAGGQRA